MGYKTCYARTYVWPRVLCCTRRKRRPKTSSVETQQNTCDWNLHVQWSYWCISYVQRVRRTQYAAINRTENLDNERLRRRLRRPAGHCVRVRKTVRKSFTKLIIIVIMQTCVRFLYRFLITSLSLGRVSQSMRTRTQTGESENRLIGVASLARLSQHNQHMSINSMNPFHTFFRFIKNCPFSRNNKPRRPSALTRNDTLLYCLLWRQPSMSARLEQRDQIEQIIFTVCRTHLVTGLTVYVP